MIAIFVSRHSHLEKPRMISEGIRLRRKGIDLLKDRQALQRLTEAAEKAKIELSGVQEAGKFAKKSK